MDTLALYTRPPQIDVPGSMLAASQVQNAQTQSDLAQMKLRQANRQEQALENYRTSGNLADLKGEPDIYAKYSEIQDADTNRKLLANARDAQSLLGMPADQRAQAWPSMLEKARSEGRIDDATHARLMQMGPSELVLNNVIRLAQKAPTRLEEAHAGLYEAQAAQAREKPSDVLKLNEGEIAYRPVRKEDGTIAYTKIAEGGQKSPSGFEADPNRPGGLKPIAGGPADKITADQAARVALMTNALNDMPKIREIYLGNEKTGKAPAFSTWTGVAAGQYYGSLGDVGEAQRLMASGMEGVLRTLTGAAATKEEVARELSKYLPAPMDSIDTRSKKLDLFERNLRSIVEMSAHGMSGSDILDRLKNANSTGKQTERLPSSATTAPRSTQVSPLPPDQHAAAIAEANAAIKAGKDREAVKKRLRELGVEFEETSPGRGGIGSM